MTDYCPYCFLYENSGDLYVSTAVQLEANKSLRNARVATVGSTTTVTYEVYEPPVGGPAKVHTPADEEIPWDGSNDWTVVVVVDNGGVTNNTTLSSGDLN